MGLALVLVLMSGVQAALPPVCYEAAGLPEASAEALPRWRGFNLLEKFILDADFTGPFQEADFRLISELGFNFVRLPMDYRFWILDGDWEQINEAAFGDLDQAVVFGATYNIHVCMNFHRAPGYTVARPPEPASLWEDAEAQRVCAQHWRYFARRYKGVPNRLLSFNLFNEPGQIDGATYAAVVKKMVDAIRAEDPERLIIADGLSWGAVPCEELASLRVAQATRGYRPVGVSHYMASWMTGADRFPVPEWPARSIGGGFLYGPFKQSMKSPLEIRTTLGHPVTLVVRVGEVSSHARLTVWVDGQEAAAEFFTPGPGEGPWKESVHRTEYNSYRGLYEQDVSIPIPPGAHTVTLDNTEGDWLTIVRLALRNGTGEYDSISIMPQWGEPNLGIATEPDSGRFRTPLELNADWLWETHFAPWSALRERGMGVMTGEWGAYNKTPHDVTLRWMEDSLRVFQRAGLGWALWNFRGAFGILDSGRGDVDYEPFHGHLLDRKMLDLLQRY